MPPPASALPLLETDIESGGQGNTGQQRTGRGWSSTTSICGFCSVTCCLFRAVWSEPITDWGYRQQTLQNISMYRSRPLSLIAMIPRGSSASRRLSLTANHLLSKAPSSSSSSSSSTAQARVQGPRHLSTTTTAAQDPATMSSQPEHSTLLIPGPIEFDDAVLQSMSHYR